MIAGRSPVLWYALATGLFNLLMVFGVLHWGDVQLGAVDAFLVVLLGVIANERDPLAVGTLAMTVRPSAASVAASSTVMESSSTATTTPTPALPSIGNVIDRIVAESVIALVDRLAPVATQPVTPPQPVATVPVDVQPVVATPADVPPVAVAPVGAPAVPSVVNAALYPPADENHAR